MPRASSAAPSSVRPPPPICGQRSPNSAPPARPPNRTSAPSERSCGRWSVGAGGALGALGGSLLAAAAAVVDRRRLDLHHRPVRLADLAEAARLAAHGVVDDAGHLVAVERLVLEQCLGERVEPAPVQPQHPPGARLLLAQDPLDLLVDDAGGLVGVVAGVD